MTHELLCKVEAPPYRRLLAEAFTIVDYPPIGALPAPEVRGRSKVLVTTGAAGATREEMATLPALSLICCVGTGYENVDIDAAHERGIVVVHGASTNAGAVADHAFALLLAVMRDIVRFDASARRGDWRGTLGSRPIPTGKRLGLIGMGGIGERVARRGAPLRIGPGTCRRGRLPRCRRTGRGQDAQNGRCRRVGGLGFQWLPGQCRARQHRRHESPNRGA